MGLFINDDVILHLWIASKKKRKTSLNHSSLLKAHKDTFTLLHSLAVVLDSTSMSPEEYLLLTLIKIRNRQRCVHVDICLF